MYKWVHRVGIVLLLMLWVMAGMQLAAGKKQAKEEVVAEAFSVIGDNGQEGIVEYYGQIKDTKRMLQLEDRENYLRKVAGELGIHDHILISRSYGEDNQTTILEKKGANGDTTLRLVTWREEGEIAKQTMFAHISLEGDLEMALCVRRKLKAAADEDMDSVRSFASVSGEYDGKLSLEDRDRIAEQILSQIDARIVTENRDMQLYTIYGCTPYLKESIKQGRKPVNVNIAMYYNETKDVTCVYGAVPVAGIDY